MNEGGDCFRVIGRCGFVSVEQTFVFATHGSPTKVSLREVHAAGN